MSLIDLHARKAELVTLRDRVVAEFHKLEGAIAECERHIAISIEPKPEETPAVPSTEESVPAPIEAEQAAPIIEPEHQGE